MREPTVRRYAVFGFGFLELLFYGGLVYGWATLVYVLKADGYYSHLCDTNQNETDVTPTESPYPPTCDEQDAMLNLVFTVAAFSLQGSIMFSGVVFDYFGTMLIRLVLQLLLVAGLTLMALSSPEMPVLIFPGMVCISIGGIQIILTNMQIGNLFGSRRSTVMTILSGCIDSSSFVMLIIKMSYDAGVSMRISFAIMAGATLFFLINTLILLPKDHIPWPLPPNYGAKDDRKYNVELADAKNGETIAKTGVKEVTQNPSDVDLSRQLTESYRNKDFPTLRACICSPLFFLFFVWLSILQLRMLYFLGTLNPFLVQITDGDEQLVSQYTTVFGFFQMCGVVVAPFSGMILDRNKSKRGNAIRGPYEDIRDSGLAFTATTLFYVVFSIWNVIPVLEAQYITFTLHVITRGFMFGLAAAGMPIFFPGQYFGTLYGLLFALSAIVGALQFPLFIASQRLFNDDPLVINLILMVACIFTLALPIYIHFYAKRKNNEIRSTLGDAGKTGVDNPTLQNEQS